MNAVTSSFQRTHTFQVLARRALTILAALALAAANGCAADLGAGAEDPVEGTGEALKRGGGGGGLAFSCTNGICTCDKSIENDCEDMSGVCTDASIDDLIACIDGWATTHCTCTQLRASSAGSVYTPPTGGVVWTATPVVKKPALTLTK